MDMAEPAFEIQMLDPTTLTANPLNPAVHSTRQKDALATSIEEFGWLAAPIYNATTKRLVDGHARVEEAKRRCEPIIPVRVIRVSEETEKRILASFNRIGNLVGYDDRLLAQLLADCAEAGDLAPGWNEDELGDLLLKVDKAAQKDIAGIRNEKEYGEQQPSVPSADGAYDSPATDVEVDSDAPPSHVKMLQLFLTTETEPDFQEKVSGLKKKWGTENLTDTVLRAISECAFEEGVG